MCPYAGSFIATRDLSMPLGWHKPHMLPVVTVTVMPVGWDL